MATLQEILARAQALREETALGSIDPERAGSIMYDTLQVINQMQLNGGALVITKIYASVAAMEADDAPVSDLTGNALKPGQLVVIVTTDTSSSDFGSVYRFDGIEDSASTWSFTGKIGGYPMDETPTEGSTRAVTSGGVYSDVSQLAQKVDELDKTTGSIKYGESGTNGGILKARDGTIVSNAYTTDYGVTDYIPVSGIVLTILNGGYQGATGTYAVVSFYTDINEASFMSSTKYNSQGNVSNFRIDIPFGAKYFRASMADHNTPLSFIFASLQEGLNRARGESEIILRSGFRCLVSPSTIGSQIPDIITYSGYECAIISVSEGDVINLTATGTSAARTFAFADSNKIVTRVASCVALTKVKITIPSGVAYMVINNTNIGAKSYYSPLLSLIGHEREITSIKSEQLEQDACLEGMVGKYTRAGFHPVPWGNVTKDKYWNLVDGSAGMVSASEYYARNELLSVTPGKKLKITVLSALYVSTDAAYSGYDNDGNPAYSGTARKNYSTADSSTVNSDGTTTYIFTLGSSVTQVGLFFKNVETKIEIEEDENRQYSHALDEHIQLVAGGGDTTSADSAKYYLKGASPKTFSKKVCIIAAGQSNIDGRDDYADMPAEIKAAQPITNCNYVKNSESDPFAALNITGQWAFDLVTYYNIALARELYVIKWSVGGTSIDPKGDGTYHWTADYEELDTISHSLLRKFENEIRNHIASDGNDFDVRAMLWHQGEGDRGSLGTGSADRYYDNLRNMISYVRGVVGNERLPIVTATISENSSQYDATIHAAQVRLASEDPYFVLIDMSGAPLKDSYHFNATASVYLGQMVYNALIDLGVITGTKLTPVRPW